MTVRDSSSAGLLGPPGKRVIAVTGGASGIGAATCLRFLEAGEAVWVLDRDLERAQGVCEHEAPGEGKPLQIDVTDSQSVADAFAHIRKHSARLDVVVTCAGVLKTGRIDEQSVEEWDLVIQTNLRGSWLTLKHALPLLRSSTSGVVIFVSSVHAYASRATYSAYAASKAAVAGLTGAAAIELAEDGIRVAGVAPSGAVTPLTLGMIEGKDVQSILHKLGNAYPLRRLADPIEIANAIVYLSSDAASFITGSTLIVDGGVLAEL